MVLLRNRIAGKLVAPSSQALTVQCWNNRFPSPTQGQAYKDSLNSPILAPPPLLNPLEWETDVQIKLFITISSPTQASPVVLKCDISSETLIIIAQWGSLWINSLPIFQQLSIKWLLFFTLAHYPQGIQGNLQTFNSPDILGVKEIKV